MQRITELKELLNECENHTNDYPALCTYYMNAEPRPRRLKDTWERQKHPDWSGVEVISTRLLTELLQVKSIRCAKDEITSDILEKQPAINRMKKCLDQIRKLPQVEKHFETMLELSGLIKGYDNGAGEDVQKNEIVHGSDILQGVETVDSGYISQESDLCPDENGEAEVSA